MERKNKVALAVAIGAVALLIASSAVRCTAVKTFESTTEEVPAASQQASNGVQEEVDGMDESTQRKAVGILRSHAWQVEGDASKTVSFRDGSFVESDANGVKVTAFEVTSAHEEDDHASLDVAMTRDGAGSFSSMIAIDGREGSLAISSDGFANASRYVQGSASESPATVEGVSEPYITLIDGNSEELAAAIVAYCRDRVPTATKATFDGEVYVDMAGGRVTATFHCNDKASTILSVTFADGAFTVAG